MWGRNCTMFHCRMQLQNNLSLFFFFFNFGRLNPQKPKVLPLFKIVFQMPDFAFGYKGKNRYFAVHWDERTTLTAETASLNRIPLLLGVGKLFSAIPFGSLMQSALATGASSAQLQTRLSGQFKCHSLNLPRNKVFILLSTTTYMAYYCKALLLVPTVTILILRL